MLMSEYRQAFPQELEKIKQIYQRYLLTMSLSNATGLYLFTNDPNAKNRYQKGLFRDILLLSYENFQKAVRPSVSETPVQFDDEHTTYQAELGDQPGFPLDVFIQLQEEAIHKNCHIGQVILESIQQDIDLFLAFDPYNTDIIDLFIEGLAKRDPLKELAVACKIGMSFFPSFIPTFLNYLYDEDLGGLLYDQNTTLEIPSGSPWEKLKKVNSRPKYLGLCAKIFRDLLVNENTANQEDSRLVAILNSLLLNPANITLRKNFQKARNAYNRIKKVIRSKILISMIAEYVLHSYYENPKDWEIDECNIALHNKIFEPGTIHGQEQLPPPIQRLTPQDRVTLEKKLLEEFREKIPELLKKLYGELEPTQQEAMISAYINIMRDVMIPELLGYVTLTKDMLESSFAKHLLEGFFTARLLGDRAFTEQLRTVAKNGNIVIQRTLAENQRNAAQQRNVPQGATPLSLSASVLGQICTTVNEDTLKTIDIYSPRDVKEQMTLITLGTKLLLPHLENPNRSEGPGDILLIDYKKTRSSSSNTSPSLPWLAPKEIEDQLEASPNLLGLTTEPRLALPNASSDTSASNSTAPNQNYAAPNSTPSAPSDTSAPNSTVSNSAASNSTPSATSDTSAPNSTALATVNTSTPANVQIPSPQSETSKDTKKQLLCQAIASIQLERQTKNLPALTSTSELAVEISQYIQKQQQAFYNIFVDIAKVYEKNTDKKTFCRKARQMRLEMLMLHFQKYLDLGGVNSAFYAMVLDLIDSADLAEFRTTYSLTKYFDLTDANAIGEIISVFNNQIRASLENISDLLADLHGMKYLLQQIKSNGRCEIIVWNCKGSQEILTTLQEQLDPQKTQHWFAPNHIRDRTFILPYVMYIGDSTFPRNDAQSKVHFIESLNKISLHQNGCYQILPPTFLSIKDNGTRADIEQQAYDIPQAEFPLFLFGPSLFLNLPAGFPAIAELLACQDNTCNATAIPGTRPRRFIFTGQNSQPFHNLFTTYLEQDQLSPNLKLAFHLQTIAILFALYAIAGPTQPIWSKKSRQTFLDEFFYYIDIAMPHNNHFAEFVEQLKQYFPYPEIVEMYAFRTCLSFTYQPDNDEHHYSLINPPNNKLELVRRPPTGNIVGPQETAWLLQVIRKLL